MSTSRYDGYLETDVKRIVTKCNKTAAIDGITLRLKAIIETGTDLMQTMRQKKWNTSK